MFFETLYLFSAASGLVDWDAQSDFQKLLFIIACVAMGITVIRTILMLIGLIGVDSDFDVGEGWIDIDGDGIPDIPDGSSVLDMAGVHLLSINSLVAGLAIGTWAGYFLAPHLPVWATVIITAAAVLAVMFVYALVMRAVYRLQCNGTVQLRNALGKEGSVYLTIPAERTGEGKVNVVVQEKYCEFEAVTDSSEKIPTGSRVKVVGLFDDDKLIVEPICGENKK